MDFLLRELRKLSAYVQAFEDHVVLIFSGQSASSVKKNSNRALAHVHCRGVKNKLRFTPSKTNSIVLTRKLNSVVHMNGEYISTVGEICLLGQTMDRKLMFIPYIAKACKKAINIYKGLARAVQTWRQRSQECGRCLTLFKSGVVLKACRVHRTVSLHSALILSRLLPLDIRVREAGWLYASGRKSKSTKAKSRAQSVLLLCNGEKERDLVLDATTLFFLHGLSGRDGRNLKSDTKGKKR
ncbi:hypothetical protein EVAR_14240_1 [Eumeta japonica]|uniref:Uncharacterized protein n=1 Tax=Eumeta variegata TaxID=151549 RepID=A0A4C1WB38_EUMVA|nr:hypothetical protein EVAR_14240_1 [Eumeta japonica]